MVLLNIGLKMNAMNINVNLAKLGGVVEMKNGKSVVVLPVEENEIFISERGGIYLNLQANPTEKEMYGQSHILKRFVSKEKYKSMTPEQRKGLPIVGGVKQLNYGGFNSGYQNNGQSNAPQNPVGGLEDMPF